MSKKEGKKGYITFAQAGKEFGFFKLVKGKRVYTKGGRKAMNSMRSYVARIGDEKLDGKLITFKDGEARYVLKDAAVEWNKKYISRSSGTLPPKRKPFAVGSVTESEAKVLHKQAERLGMPWPKLTRLQGQNKAFVLLEHELTDEQRSWFN